MELVVAAADVLLVEATLPPLSGARLRAALPGIAEPHLLSDLDSAYVVALAGPRATVAVLERALFAGRSSFSAGSSSSRRAPRPSS